MTLPKILEDVDGSTHAYHPDTNPDDIDFARARPMASMKPQETIADFKQRIAVIMRSRETGKNYSMVGASRIPEWCEKKPIDSPKQHGIMQHD